jgi:hypothetical protein
MTWPRAVLRKVIANKPDLGVAIETAMGVDITRLLTESWDPTTPGRP